MELACPQCAQVDQVQSVPAVFQGGQTTYRVQGSMTAVPAGDGVVYTATSHRGVSVTATAAALNPYPVLRGGGCFLTLALLLLIPAFVFVSFANDVLAENPAPTAGGRAGAAIGAWIFPFGAFALVALFAVLFVLSCGATPGSAVASRTRSRTGGRAGSATAAAASSSRAAS